MKRFLILISIICMLFSVSVLATESEEFYSGDYRYTLLEDGTAEIEEYTGEASELVIPGELDGHAVTSIGDRAFFDCGYLSSITLPEGVMNIGEAAFSSCYSLSSILLPDSIEMMGINPFSNSITTIDVSPDHPYLAVIDGVLFSKSDKKLIYFPNNKENYIVPDGIQSIGEWAFVNCNKLSSITLPEGLTSIGERAFSNCRGLSTITLPEGLTNIGDYAFEACRSLSSLILPEELTTIGEGAFSTCNYLSSITLPEGLTSIGDYAFSYCENMSSITLPEGLTSIGENAFEGCNRLTFTVYRDSYAAEYCKERGLNYTYAESDSFESSERIDPIVNWDENLLRDGSTEFNCDLALYCARFCNEAYNLKQLSMSFRDLGFNGAKSYNYSKSDTLGKYEGENCFYIAHNEMTIAGKKTGVLVLVCRGTDMMGERLGDWLHGHPFDKTRDFYGVNVWTNIYDFYDDVMKGMEDYVDRHPEVLDYENIKFIVTGHSLGGAAANLAGADITLNDKTNKWWSEKVSQSDIYVYTFGAIKVLVTDDNKPKGFENIHNIYNYYDSFGPNGNMAILNVSSLHSQFGHSDVFKNDKFKLEEYWSNSVIPTTVNHDMNKNYISAVSYERMVGGLFEYNCDSVTDEASSEVYSASADFSCGYGNVLVKPSNNFDFIKTDSELINWSLALQGVCLSKAIYEGNGDEAKDLLYALGYDEAEPVKVTEEGNAGFLHPVSCLGYKHIIDENGTEKNVFAIVVRGVRELDDFSSAVEDAGNLSMWITSKTYVKKDLFSFIESKTMKSIEEIKKEENYFFITGHSWGGATANVLSVEKEIMELAGGSKSKVYTYTYESPHTCKNLLWEPSESMSFAFNFKNKDDFITDLPPWFGFTTYGKDIPFTVHDLENDIFTKLFPEAKGGNVLDVPKLENYGDPFGHHDLGLNLVYIIRQGIIAGQWREVSDVAMFIPGAPGTGTINQTAPEIVDKLELGDHTNFGSYEQDNDTSNGKESIEWQVLAKDEDKAMIISKYALDIKAYNDSYAEVTWENCSLRFWLNNEFYETAFTEEEKAKIITTYVAAEDNREYGTDAGNDTEDKVFLLSISEAENTILNDEAKVCYPTEYAKGRGEVYLDNTGACGWYLRSPGDYRGNATSVTTSGSLFSSGDEVTIAGGIRPVVWINTANPDDVE